MRDWENTMTREHLQAGGSLLALILLVGLASAQSIDSARTAAEARRADIRKMMELTGSGKLGVQVFNQLLTNFKSNFPQVPGQFWEDFSKEVSAEELQERLIPVYEKNFTGEDIRGLIQFYRSPLGQKLTKITPQISHDAMEIGSQWGQEIGNRLLKKLEQGGYIKQST
jgi:uncharacterized protein